MSDSNKKSLSKKQSRIDGFFKNPPKSTADDLFVRVNQADTDMEKAIELSLKSADGGKENLNRDVPNTEAEGNSNNQNKEGEEEEEENGRSKPTFAHVEPPVRKKEERKKLRGFDCG